jgi:hypothetical protein
MPNAIARHDRASFAGLKTIKALIEPLGNPINFFIKPARVDP